jgi:folate-binding protein YgfZ
MLQAEWQSYLDLQSDQPQAKHGVCYLPELGVLRFSGTDVLNFLQGYLTCDTIDLRPETLTPMAVCNLKGRVVVTGWCYRHDNAAGMHSVNLIMHRSLTERVAQFFKAYAMFSKTEITNDSDTTLLFGGLGNAEELAAVGGLNGILIVSDKQWLLPVSDLTEAKSLWLVSSQTTPEAWWLELIGIGVALISNATSEEFLPQMLDLERVGAVDFDKGCYLGQEIVARAQHRGQVKRRLARLEWGGRTAPEAGARFGTAENPARNLGTIVASVTVSSGTGACLAVVANDAPGPFQYQDTVLNRVI